MRQAFGVLFQAAVVLAASISFQSTGNPILADGSYYTADPAPLAFNNTLYIITGHDTAGPTTNSFIMNDWQMLVSSSPDPAGGTWTLQTSIATPQSVFKWAAAGTAYAAQVVQGRDGRFYLYAPVTQANSPNSDPFAIGVAVANGPLGPYTDAHPSGPIISQSIPSPGNTIQNIDPTVLVDDDGRVYIYFGTFGQLLAYELNTDMVTIRSTTVTRTDSLTGFFEAPFLFKRQSTYYLLYAANNAGTNSPCTPTSYHACIAYGTSSSALGPWTFRSVILPIVSSTTSHPGAVSLNNNWYLTYHTADATGGTHFRRSVAIDRLTFDDTRSPPLINRVTPTKRAGPPRTPTRNIAPEAAPSSANQTPIQYWLESLHDEQYPANPLPPDYWCSYDGTSSPATNILTYTWSNTVSLNGVRMAFFADQPAGSNIGVAPPAGWFLEYLDEATWKKVANRISYPTVVTDSPAEVGFDTVSTRSIRAVLAASGSGGQYAGVGVKEWEALAPTAQ